jgi:hypothetical protein
MSDIRCAALLCALTLAAACSSDDGETTPVTSPDAGGDQTDGSNTDAGSAADAAAEEDVATVGDVSRPPDEDTCPTADLLEAWPLNDEFGEGDVTNTVNGDSNVVVIDASAGGSQAAAGNAFIYFDFITGEQQLLTDHESLIDSDWILGFRRSAIRLNSGDSGPGGWEMARVSDTTFDDVTAPPDNSVAWEIDATFDGNCDIVRDPINIPVTAINFLNRQRASSSWYEYSDSGVGVADGDVYVVRNTDRELAFKFAIEAWDNGEYTIRWAAL